jgi:acetyl esterase/lipase
MQKVVEETDSGGRGRDVTGVTDPTVSVYRSAKASDTAILVIPGGGFTHVMLDKEGDDVCRWLAASGVHAGSLLYRLPGDGWAAREDAPMQDAARALRLLAQRTGAKRLGVMGFSAGGTIAAALATRWDESFYPPLDAADRVEARPSFMALGYPYLNLPPPPGGQASMFHGMTGKSPPAFFFLSADDKRVEPENSLAAFRSLLGLKVPAALHVFESGGHGYALRASKGSSQAQWPQLFLTWARAGGHIG